MYKTVLVFALKIFTFIFNPPILCLAYIISKTKVHR